MTSQVHAIARLERVLVSSRKTSLLIMLGKVLQSSCRMKMDVMMMPRASDCASTLRPYAHQMATEGCVLMATCHHPTGCQTHGYG